LYGIIRILTPSPKVKLPNNLQRFALGQALEPMLGGAPW